MDVLPAILTLIAGIGVFLIACYLLSQNIEAITGSKLRNLFQRASDKKMVGVGVGAVTTAAIQSSGATSVLVMGFVNAGLMSLTLATAMIYGANIGTTITGVIVALGLQGEGSLSLITILSAIAGIGAFIAVYSKKEKHKKIGFILTAFGLLFVGLSMMSGAMQEFAHMDSVKEAISSVHNLFILVIIGVVLTAIVQSSSVMMSVSIAMLFAGLIDLQQGIYIAIGTNIGSTVVALLASSSVNRDAKRIAMAHLLFNVFGVIIFLVAGFILRMFDVTYAGIMEGIFGSGISHQAIGLAVFDVIFNVVVVIIMLPLTAKLLALTDRIVPKSAAAESTGPRLFFVNDYMLNTPGVAVGEVKNEIVKMLGIAMDNVRRACRIVTTLDMTEVDELNLNEKQLNYTNKKLTQYITRLSNKDLSEKDRMYLSTAYHSITDIERIGDYAVNIVEYADKMISNNDSFSEAANASIDDMLCSLEELYRRTLDAYQKKDRELVKYAHEIEQEIDAKAEKMGIDHVARLADGTCSPAVASEFLMLSSDLERVGDHLYNVAKSVKGITKKPAADRQPAAEASS